MSEATTTAAPAPSPTPAGGDPAPAPAATPAAPAPAATPAPATPPATPPADDGKPKEGDPPKAPAAPEAYADFKLPEGVKLDDATMGDFKTLAKEMNLPQEAAQKLVDLGAKMQQGSAQQLLHAVEEQGKAWGEAAKVDKEIGGEKFAENLSVATKALEKFGTPELKSLLDQSKLGNHPEVLRAFYRIGKAISEDGFVPGRAGQGGGDSIAQRMFPNMNP